MEYEGIFIDDARSYFPMTLIRPCQPEETGVQDQFETVLKPSMELYGATIPEVRSIRSSRGR